jgi:chromate transport protein ChrA
MVFLSWLYVRYGKLPQVTDALYVLKPAVLGIIAAGIIKLGRASITNAFLGILLIGSFFGMRFAGINFLLILLIAGITKSYRGARLRRCSEKSGNFADYAGWNQRTNSIQRFSGCSKSPGCFSKQDC